MLSAEGSAHKKFRQLIANVCNTLLCGMAVYAAVAPTTQTAVVDTNRSRTPCTAVTLIPMNGILHLDTSRIEMRTYTLAIQKTIAFQCWLICTHGG